MIILLTIIEVIFSFNKILLVLKNIVSIVNFRFSQEFNDKKLTNKQEVVFWQKRKSLPLLTPITP